MSALESGKKNYRLNGLEVNDRDFNKYRVEKFVRQRARSKMGKRQGPEDGFDLVIVDPSPPPHKYKSAEDMCEKYYAPLFRMAAKITRSNGRVAISCHPKIISSDLFARVLIAGLDELNATSPERRFTASVSENIGYPANYEWPELSILVIFTIIKT